MTLLELLRPLRRMRRMVPPAVVLAVAGLVTATAFATSAVVPQNTAPPSIGGSAREGQTLTASNGSWSGNPTSFNYSWQRCSATGTDCASITGATNRTYTPGAADVDHKLRVVVTAVNADGQTAANSAPTYVVSGGNAPVSTAKPAVSGSATVGEELTASNGTWTGGATSFAYQWQRCDSAGTGCADATDATSKTYGVRTADVGKRLRVQVTAKNASSSSTASSDPTAVVSSAGGGGTTTVTTAGNRAPTISFISLKRSGARVTARFRACDDRSATVTVVERDVKLGVAAYTRRFAAPARPCRTAVRSWTPPARFRKGGRYTATLRAVDKSGKTSRTVSRSLSF
jgi:hypothetical protein